MANIKTSVVQQGQAIVIRELNDNFKLMAAALQNDKTTALTLEQGYMSAYDVVDELRKLVKDKTTTPPSDIAPLLDSNKSITDIVKDGTYIKLFDFLNKLTASNYEPPLASSFTSAEGVETYPYPNYPAKDPRRTGMLIKPGPVDTLKSPEILKWMVNNSVLYGYVLYADNALYYLGVDKIKTRLQKASNKQDELKKIVGTFLKSASTLSLLSTTADKVISNRLPDNTNFADPGNLEELPSHGFLLNDKVTIPELVVVDGQPVQKKVALAYLAMKEEANKDGVVLSVNSGFRPGFGPNKRITSSKGNSINFTTQETLRRDKGRWVASERAKYPSDDDFVFKAPASAFNPATAAPGSSNHGSGVAIDLNVGGRKNFSPLKTANYVWLIKNGYKFGFVRTVSTEEWHFEYLPNLAKNGPYAKVDGTDAKLFYADLGLNAGAFTI
jgi:LAS superfamily LD-carboxypeptidase LdcB